MEKAKIQQDQKNKKQLPISNNYREQSIEAQTNKPSISLLISIIGQRVVLNDNWFHISEIYFDFNDHQGISCFPRGADS